MAEATIDEETVSMDELVAAEAVFDGISTASVSNTRSVERASEGHAAVKLVTSAVRGVETEVIAITSSCGTTQGNPSKSDSRTDSVLFDSSPSTHCYTRRVPQRSRVSTDSKKTPSATLMVSTPSSRLHKSSDTAFPPAVIVAMVSTTATVQEERPTPTAAEETSGDGDVPLHISDILEGQVFEDTPVGETLVAGTNSVTGVT